MRPVKRFEDSAANWAARSLPLPANWEAVESDTKLVKHGDGLTPWSLLPYVSETAFFNVKEYGAAMNGTTNDAAAFKSAFDACVLAGGGTVYIPSGTMLYSGDPGAFNGISTFPNITVLGANGSNVILSGSPYLWFGNFGILRFENLTFIGSAGADMQSADRIFQFGFCQQAVMNNCRFYGLGSNGSGILDGIVLFYNSPGVMSNCYFVGCSASASGVVTSNAGSGFVMRDCRFIDIGEYRGVSYSTSPKAYCYSWLRFTGQDNITGANYKSVSIDNCVFDEAPLWGVRFEGSAVTTKYTVNITNTSFNCGNDRGAGVFTKAIYASYAGFVQLNTVYAGFLNNAADYSFAEFSNCDAVEMTKVVGLYGASYVTFSNTTKRVKIRNCTLAGNVTYPLGFDNTAAAFIDADSPMPATVAAAALSPLGKTTHVTGNTNITSITTTNLKAGDEITLIFDGTPTLTNGNNIVIGTNFVATVNDAVVLRYDGLNMIGISTRVN